MMRRSDAREIRKGIMVARQVARRERTYPRGMTVFGIRGAPAMPLWEQAFHREYSRRVQECAPAGVGETGEGK